MKRWMERIICRQYELLGLDVTVHDALPQWFVQR